MVKNDPNYKQFVSNHSKNILKLASPEMWIHCSTEDNSADIGTRGKSAAELKNNSLWWTRPEWLKGSPERYPLQITPQELESNECSKQIDCRIIIITTVRFIRQAVSVFLTSYQQRQKPFPF